MGHFLGLYHPWQFKCEKTKRDRVQALRFRRKFYEIAKPLIHVLMIAEQIQLKILCLQLLIYARVLSLKDKLKE